MGGAGIVFAAGILLMPAALTGRAQAQSGPAAEEPQPAATQPAATQPAATRFAPTATPDTAPRTSDTHRYALRPISDGTFFYQGPGFTATIAADGAVVFHPVHWKVTTELGDLITGQGDARNPATWGAWPVPLPPDWRPTPYDNRERLQDSLTPEIPVAQPIFVDPGGRFDLSDEYARQVGTDPYLEAKTWFLSDTFDFRMRLAARQHRQALGAALAELPSELESIARDPRFSPPERRQIIYLIWHETSDDAGGAQARQIIESFVRQTFPPADAARFSR